MALGEGSREIGPPRSAGLGLKAPLKRRFKPAGWIGGLLTIADAGMLRPAQKRCEPARLMRICPSRAAAR